MEDYLLVDGYNIILAWRTPIWTPLASASRTFSAIIRDIKNAETADQYIEKVTQEIGRTHHVRVATSDRLEQVIILGKGAVRLSARDLQKEIRETNDEIHKQHLERTPSRKNRLFDNVDADLFQYLEDIRLNRKK